MPHLDIQNLEVQGLHVCHCINFVNAEAALWVPRH